MGHDIIINGVPISEDALREMLEMLEHQNTSDRDEPGACIRSENFEWVISDDGDIVIKKILRYGRWIDIKNAEREETGRTLTKEEEAERWHELKKEWASMAESEQGEDNGPDNGPDAEKLLREYAASIAAQDRRISWAYFVLHNPRATEEQRQRAQEIMDSIPDYDEEEDGEDD